MSGSERVNLVAKKKLAHLGGPFTPTGVLQAAVVVHCCSYERKMLQTNFLLLMHNPNASVNAFENLEDFFFF